MVWERELQVPIHLPWTGTLCTRPGHSTGCSQCWSAEPGDTVGSFPVFCKFETGYNRVADPWKCLCVCRAIWYCYFYILFYQRQAHCGFHENFKYRWAVTQYAYSGASASCLWKDILGMLLALHSWTVEQPVNLLSLLRGCIPPAGRFPPEAAANKLPERASSAPCLPCLGRPTETSFVVLSLLIWHQRRAGRSCFSVILRDFDTCCNHPSGHLQGV